ncbi:fimbrial protein [Klebsiella oxytoca]|uniref:fimbrial protein n=1 Tax=Klebsiella oxytoca TaxID=571 RepID=UPI00292F6B7C|nr:fimbrial protein [Klebsiella oxytoca]
MSPVNLRKLLLLLTVCISGSVLADATVNFSGTLIEAPPCVVNNNNVITVNFGNEVMTTRIDGTQYRKPIDFDLDCSMAVSSKQKVRITGTPQVLTVPRWREGKAG